MFNKIQSSAPSWASQDAFYLPQQQLKKSERFLFVPDQNFRWIAQMKLWSHDMSHNCYFNILSFFLMLKPSRLQQCREHAEMRTMSRKIWNCSFNVAVNCRGLLWDVELNGSEWNVTNIWLVSEHVVRVLIWIRLDLRYGSWNGAFPTPQVTEATFVRLTYRQFCCKPTSPDQLTFFYFFQNKVNK